MSAFLFALVAVVIAGFGARDQTLLAALSAHRGPRLPVLAVAVAVAAITAAGAAWLGWVTAPLLVGEGRAILLALSLVLAGFEALVLRPQRHFAEPTHSLGALAVVLLARQLTDAARLLVFAIALSSSAPTLAGMGGAVGGAISAGIGWGAGAALLKAPLALGRRLIGGAMLVLGITLGLGAKGWL